MTGDEKILFLEKLLSQASKRLVHFGWKKDFFLFDDVHPFYMLGTKDLLVNRINEKTSAAFNLPLAMHGNAMLEKSRKEKHSIHAIINRWKNSKSVDDEDILLAIVDQLEHEAMTGWAIGLKFFHSMVPGMVMWHANVPIEQLAIELDVAS